MAFKIHWRDGNENVGFKSEFSFFHSFTQLFLLIEFQGTIFKFGKRNKNPSLLVYVLHKTQN